MAETRQLTVKMAIQAADYRKQLKAINTQNKLLKSEFESLSEASEDFEDSLEGQGAKLKVLEGHLKGAKQKMTIYTKEVSKCEKTLEQATDAYDKQSTEVATLTRALDSARKEFGENSEEVNKLEKSLEQATKKLDKKQKAVINANDALQRMKINVNNTQKEINRLERETSECSKKLKSMGSDAQDLSSDLDNLGSSSFKNILGNFDGMSGKIGNALELAGKLSKAFIDLGVNSVKWLGKVISNIVTLTAKIGTVVGAIAGLSVKLAGEFKAMDEMMNATFGENLEKAQKRIETLAKNTGIAFGRLKQPFSQFYSQLKGSGLEAEEALSRTEQGMGLVADAAAYYNMSMEEASELLRSFIRGNTEAGDRIGLFTSEAQRNTKAVEKYGKKWLELTEAQKQMLMLDISEEIYKSSGAIGQAKREADGLENVIGNLTYNTKEFIASIGSKMLENAIWNLKDLGNILGKTSKIVQEQGLSKAFEYMVDEITKKLSSMADNIPTIMGNFISAINDFITNSLPDILKLGTKIIDNIGEGISKNKEAISKGISNVISSISNFIITNMPTILDIGKTIIEAIGTAIENNKESLRESIRILVETASTLFIEYKSLIIESALELGGAFIQGLWQGIWNAGANYKPTNDNFYLPKEDEARLEGEKYGTAWVTSSGKVLSEAPSFWDTLSSNDTYTQVTLDAENTAYAYVNGLRVKVSEQTPQVQQAVRNLLKSSGLEKEEGKSTGNNVVTGIKEGIESKTSEVTSAISNTTKKATETAKTESKNIKNEIANSLSGIGNIATDETGKIPKATQQNLNESARIIKQFGSDAYNGVRTSFTKLEEVAKQSFSNMYNGCKTSINKLKQVTLQGATDIYNKSRNSFNSMAQAAMSAYSKMYNNCMKSINKLKTNTISAWDSIRSSLSKSINGKVNITKTTAIGKEPKHISYDDVQNTLYNIGNSLMIPKIDVGNIALSGSYYNQRTSLSNEVGGFSNLSSGNNNVSVYNNTDTSRLEELMANMISILNTQNSLIKENKPVVNLDGQQLSNKLDKINGQNMKLYERFNT